MQRQRVPRHLLRHRGVRSEAAATEDRQALESRADSSTLQTLSALDALLGSTDDASNVSISSSTVEGASFALSRSREALPPRSVPGTSSSARHALCTSVPEKTFTCINQN